MEKILPPIVMAFVLGFVFFLGWMMANNMFADSIKNINSTTTRLMAENALCVELIEQRDVENFNIFCNEF